MFKKKEKIKEENLESNQAAEQKQIEEELVDKVVPNPQTAITIVRDAINNYVMCICNISKQYKHDIGTCLDYLFDYIKEHNEIDSIINSIDDNSLVQLSTTFERNGYTIDININKASKK